MMDLTAGGHEVRMKGLLILVSASLLLPGSLTADIDPVEASGVTGGLIVHIGCGDGRVTAKLRRGPRYRVHGLDTDAAKVAAARRYIRERGLYGHVAVDTFDGKTLPYVDNLVNLVVLPNADVSAEASAKAVFRLPNEEIARVLAPRGVALFHKDLRSQVSALSPQPEGDWLVFRKPVPSDIDDWPHFLYGPGNNAVSGDTAVGPPRRLQWQCGPLWSRSHEADMSMTGAVSAGGRIFYFIDEGPIGIHETPRKTRQLPDKASLVCRDAFNGIALWKRPVADWGARSWDNNRLAPWAKASERVFSSPLTLPRRLVAAGGRLFVTLGYRACLSELDASTGKTIRQFETVGNVDEILAIDGKLVLRVREIPRGGAQAKPDSVAVVDIESGRTLWQKEVGRLGDLTLAADGGRVCFCNEAGVSALKLETGDALWQTLVKQARLTLPTLVMHNDVVILANSRQARGLAAATGKQLWQRQVGDSFRGPPDAFVVNGRLWLGTLAKMALDPRTGTPVKEVHTGNLFTPGHHVRCYRGRGTENYLMWSKRGVEFVDLKGDGHSRNDWVRGTCRYGLMPANGMVYMPPTPCFCFPGVKLNGFNALAPASAKATAGKPGGQESERLEKGPAYGETQVSGLRLQPSHSWPTYRHDNRRSGAVDTTVPGKLGQAWKTEVGGRLTPPVLARGRLYAADKDSHAVHCLDAATGKLLWRYTAGGPVDSPPTINDGRMLFGCTDGWVYCLEAENGALIWRFRAAPRDRRIVSYGQVQSSWPLHGSVLVKGRTAYVAAGRSSFLDGGLFLYGLDTATGAVRHRQRLDGPRDDPGRKSPHGAHWMDGGRTDILVCENEKLYMLQNVFDLALNPLEAPVIAKHGARKMERHLIASGGFLDDTGFDRVYWMYAARWPGLYYGYRAPKTGQILVFDKDTTYALHTFSGFFSRSPYFAPGTGGLDLVADDNDNEPVLTPKAAAHEREPGHTRQHPPKWQVKVPLRARAMVLAGGTLFLAGPPDVVNADDPLAAFEGRSGAMLQAIAANDGSTIADYGLDAPPVFDGMIAVDKKLYLCMKDGTIRCWSAPRKSSD